MAEGRGWLDRGAGAPPRASPRRCSAKAEFAAGYAALGQGDFPQAKPFFEQSLELAREAGDARLEARRSRRSAGS